MTQAAVNFKLDSDLKQRFTSTVQSMGLTPSAAFTVFVKAVVRENAIPFPLVGDEPEDVEYPYDPVEEARFYSPKNVASILEAEASLARGEGITVTMEQLEAMAQ